MSDTTETRQTLDAAAARHLDSIATRIGHAVMAGQHGDASGAGLTYLNLISALVVLGGGGPDSAFSSDDVEAAQRAIMGFKREARARAQTADPTGGIPGRGSDE